VYTHAPVIKDRTSLAAPRKEHIVSIKQGPPCEYLSKDEATSELVKHIPIAGAGEPPLSPSQSAALATQTNDGSALWRARGQDGLREPNKANHCPYSPNFLLLFSQCRWVVWECVVPIVTAINQ
jgi:hypothetical protein